MPLRLLQRSNGRSPGGVTRLYYASDVHGSALCWRKFIGAGRFYRVDALVMGGDLTGKAIVPVELRPDGSAEAEFLGERRHAGSDEELGQLLDAIRFNGMYPWVATRGEIDRCAQEEVLRAELFDRVILQEAEAWMSLAAERLAGEDIGIFVIAGNDDPWSIDEVLASAAGITFCDDRVVHLAEHEMISCSFSNRTPWNSPRELDEDDLYTRLKALCEQLEHPESAIFNLHVPPYDSGLDLAPQLNPDLSRVFRGGVPVEIPVGSRAVRQLIEEYQPLLALHGHIHESRGEARIGRTLAINPGSEYNSGHIHGAIISLSRDRVISHQLAVG